MMSEEKWFAQGGNLDNSPDSNTVPTTTSIESNVSSPNDADFFKPVKGLKDVSMTPVRREEEPIDSKAIEHIHEDNEVGKDKMTANASFYAKSKEHTVTSKRKIGIGLICGAVPLFFIGLAIHNEFKAWYQLYRENGFELFISYLLMAGGILLLAAGIYLIIHSYMSKEK
jgi:hypothetical protein